MYYYRAAGMNYVIPANMLLEVIMCSMAFYITTTTSRDKVTYQTKIIDNVYRSSVLLYLLTSVLWLRFYIRNPKSDSTKCRIMRGAQGILLATIGVVSIWTGSRKCGEEMCPMSANRIIAGVTAIIDSCIYTIRPNYPATDLGLPYPRRPFVIPVSETGRELYLRATLASNYHNPHVHPSVLELPPSYEEVAPPDYNSVVNAEVAAEALPGSGTEMVVMKASAPPMPESTEGISETSQNISSPKERY